MPKNNKPNYTYAVGKRRSAIARVRIFKGKGENTVNSKPIEDYFPGAVNKEIWSKPFKAVEGSDKYFVSVKVTGGGLKGQLDAATHAVAKALAKENREAFRTPLKKLGLLTRDSRIRERRKVGMGGKARRKKQSPKR